MADGKRNLGRGLAALLGDDEEAEAAVSPEPDTAPAAEPAAAPAASGQGRQHVAIDRLAPNPYQPRRAFDEESIAALADSIAANGIFQPLLVRPAGEGGEAQFEIIAGERRWRAAQRAQLHEVPVVVRELSDVAALEIAIVENVQRRDLTPLEEAQGYQRLMDEFQHTQEDLARAVGKSRSHIANMLRLLQLPERVKVLVQTGDISAGHARALLNADDTEGLARQVAERGLSVRDTEKLAQQVKAASTNGEGAGAQRRSNAAEAKDADTRALEDDVAAQLGLKVKIAPKGKGGTVTLHYTSLDQLDDVVHRLCHGPAKTDPH
ncbi:chromosome partitioning protein, ParB family [Limimonas halophila]|uniref:Chromosome partitioning protein, ParB family n=1 Tax=Limimonas halophila TaxID=1082479 RepID=A0A1G7SMU0_9PROT|nr:ParB/RepB/Spo0J family partition protein [Limimonas halophila]SDG24417.1 chromosome partitioning protein, ParB family [Limimonas halophila]